MQLATPVQTEAHLKVLLCKSSFLTIRATRKQMDDRILERSPSVGISENF